MKKKYLIILYIISIFSFLFYSYFSYIEYESNINKLYTKCSFECDYKYPYRLLGNKNDIDKLGNIIGFIYDDPLDVINFNSKGLLGKVKKDMYIRRNINSGRKVEIFLDFADFGIKNKSNNYGFSYSEASLDYFNQKSESLSLIESIILLNIPENPDLYSPYSYKKNEDGELVWKAKAKDVLFVLYEEGFIAKEDYMVGVDEVEIMRVGAYLVEDL